MQPRVLFGGTFDPVHRGHIEAAREVARALGATVHLMPANRPPHRGKPGASAADRLAMLELAVAAYPELAVDDRELGRDAPSWTVETLRGLRGEVGAEVPLILMIGADAFSKFDSWRDWREILELASVIVLTRPGAGDAWSAALGEAVQPRLVEDVEAVRSHPAGRVLPFSVTPVPVSSTEVRARLAAGTALSGLVPDPVANYIAVHGLYR
jgi:nicotinate-nucleotide adenylyltransferase